MHPFNSSLYRIYIYLGQLFMFYSICSWYFLAVRTPFFFCYKSYFFLFETYLFISTRSSYSALKLVSSLTFIDTGSTFNTCLFEPLIYDSFLSGIDFIYDFPFEDAIFDVGALGIFGFSFTWAASGFNLRSCLFWLASVPLTSSRVY